MHHSTPKYLSHVRSQTAYPAFRSFIKIAVFIGYLQIGIGALVCGINVMTASMLFGDSAVGKVLGAVLAFTVIGVSVWLSILLLHFLRDLGLMLVDFFDASAQKNAADYKDPQPTGGKISAAAMEESGLPLVKKKTVDSDAFKSI